MKNCISRRSFLKAAGILGAAGALAACGGSSSSTTTASSAPASSAAGAAASSTSIKLWTYPIGGWGNDETVQGLVSSFTFLGNHGLKGGTDFSIGTFGEGFSGIAAQNIGHGRYHPFQKR